MQQLLYQKSRRYLNVVLHTVMFRGTPCICSGKTDLGRRIDSIQGMDDSRDRRMESIQRKGWKVCRGKDGKYTEERMESIQRKGW